MTEKTILLLQNAPPTLKSVFEKLKIWNYNIELYEPGSVYLHQLAILPIIATLPLSFYQGLIADFKINNPTIKIFALFTGVIQIKINDLLNIGVNQVYRIPFDEELFMHKILDHLPVEIQNSDVTWDHLSCISIVDFEMQKKAELDLFLFLPTNQKIIHYISEGTQIEARVIEKFKKNSQLPLYIKKNDFVKYKKNLLQVFKNAQSQDNLQEKMSQVMTPFFTEGHMSEEEQKQFIHTLDDVLESLIPENKKIAIQHIKATTSQKMTNHSHSGNVSIYCALFGSLCGFKEIDELKLGGYMHDVGLADIPVEILEKPEHQRDETEKATYHLHPGLGKQEIENKKLKVSQTVMNMILLHHERIDGTGYPYKKQISELPLEAQICALADEFDKMTSIRPGFKTYTPKEALLELLEKNVMNATDFKKIYKSFISDPEKATYMHTQKESKIILKDPVTLKEIRKTKPTISKNSIAVSAEAAEILADVKKYFADLYR